MSKTIFLYRQKDEPHVFLSTQEPLVRYELICGNCEFPIREEDDHCPRCQFELEKCPICSDRTHSRAKVVPRESDGGLQCPVCRMRRMPDGLPLNSIGGSFCTNIYGCPAGGLLLKEDELAIIPDAAATRCPVCRHDALSPLGVRTFNYQTRRCLFCFNCFGPHLNLTGDRPSAVASARADKRTLFEPVELLQPNPETGEGNCPLCGRNDRLDQEEVFWGGTLGDKANEGSFRHVVELGRLLVFIHDEKALGDKAFELWFDETGSSSDRGDDTVASVVELLLISTIDPIHRKILEIRTKKFLETWSRNLRGGLNYRLPSRKKRD